MLMLFMIPSESAGPHRGQLRGIELLALVTAADQVSDVAMGPSALLPAFVIKALQLGRGRKNTDSTARGVAPGADII